MSIPTLLTQAASGGFLKVNNYYDRNPLSIAQTYSVTVGPHGNTQRLSYTVPTSRIAFMELILAYVARITAATTAVAAGQFVEWTPAGTTTIFQNWFDNNNVDVQCQVTTTQLGYLNSGDVLDIKDGDGSTGGTVKFEGSIKFCEFDQ